MVAVGPGRDARAKLRRLQERVIAWFGDCDAWLLPTTPVFPPVVGQFDGLDRPGLLEAVAPIGAFTAAFNATGQPAVTLPAGKSTAGLPVGVQLVGRCGCDRSLISLAAALERALPQADTSGD